MFVGIRIGKATVAVFEEESQSEVIVVLDKALELATSGLRIMR